ncbi:hypothetical protein CDAR_66801 [Caerostris darwini]|uniref:Uncharacterized protein n=1 Tax=Caerostris darwini TaxID=1538125 RepID=A0AAV4R761_9ARAC|nr:hypothetical protein CDAR_66801 [Caerostris darwini]
MQYSLKCVQSKHISFSRSPYLSGYNPPHLYFKTHSTTKGGACGINPGDIWCTTPLRSHVTNSSSDPSKSRLPTGVEGGGNWILPGRSQRKNM